jgi:hypothetical protein
MSGMKRQHASENSDATIIGHGFLQSLLTVPPAQYCRLRMRFCDAAVLCRDFGTDKKTFPCKDFTCDKNVALSMLTAAQKKMFFEGISVIAPQSSRAPFGKIFRQLCYAGQNRFVTRIYHCDRA